MRKVLFVCRANVCRSPMAAAIFNALAEDGDLPARAESAGVAALVGSPIAPNAGEALGELGIYVAEHRSRQVDRAMLGEVDLVLAMTPRQTAELSRLSEGLPVHPYTLPEYSASGDEGIPDPYGLPMSAYRASARQLLGYIDLAVERLGKERGDGP